MYQSSPASSSQRSTPSSGLIRYGSAPESMLTTAVDSVVGSSHQYSAIGSQAWIAISQHHRRYFLDDSPSESSCRDNPDLAQETDDAQGSSALEGSFGLNGLAVGDFETDSNYKIAGAGGDSPSESCLVRHNSLPPVFHSHRSHSNNSFTITRGAGGFSSEGGANGSNVMSRLKPQLGFTRQDSSLSQISEVSENIEETKNPSSRQGDSGHSYAFGVDSWENNNSIVFSVPPSKHLKSSNGDLLNRLYSIDSQFRPQTTLAMGLVEKPLQIPEDSVPCKIRAKRGCATHPRSIAERERRTRISGKLKKLQELVPHMDKQTSYADMLDLAVQHIKGLQKHVQKLNGELENCTCGCKPVT